MPDRRSEKHENARSSLPEELGSVFDDFVADYEFAATNPPGRDQPLAGWLAQTVKTGPPETATNSQGLRVSTSSSTTVSSSKNSTNWSTN